MKAFAITALALLAASSRGHVTPGQREAPPQPAAHAH